MVSGGPRDVETSIRNHEHDHRKMRIMSRNITLSPKGSTGTESGFPESPQPTEYCENVAGIIVSGGPRDVDTSTRNQEHDHRKMKVLSRNPNAESKREHRNIKRVPRITRSCGILSNHYQNHGFWPSQGCGNQFPDSLTSSLQDESSVKESKH